MEVNNSQKRLEDKVALITGASRGIGRAIAIQYAKEGADLFLCATNMDKLKETQDQVSPYGKEVEIYQVDISDRNAVEQMVDNALNVFGRVDILVNNAGIYKPSPFVDYTYEDFDRIIKVNLYGPFNVTQFVLKDMLKHKWGKIVNIASTAGKWASFNQSAYNISKHGVVALTRCLGLELAKSGITVNGICPGVTRTDAMTKSFAEGHAELMDMKPEAVIDWVFQRVPLGRWLEPKEIAYLATYLASSESDGMIGQTILLDGGMLFV